MVIVAVRDLDLAQARDRHALRLNRRAVFGCVTLNPRVDLRQAIAFATEVRLHEVEVEDRHVVRE
jgi:hypothetical protein